MANVGYKVLWPLFEEFYIGQDLLMDPIGKFYS